jgi:very-short-patch-repair endonuclease
VGVPARTPGAIHTSQRADEAARRLRRAPTFAEGKLWKVLRKTDLHFRRQAPIGPYVVDFVCHAARLVVEVDGEVHELPEVAARDVRREAWLTGRGYQVIRFSNDQAISDPHSLVQLIVETASARTPTPTPPRKGEGDF